MALFKINRAFCCCNGQLHQLFNSESVCHVQDQSQRRSTMIAPAVWLAEFLSMVNDQFAVKPLARSEFYSTALSDAIDVVWEYHRWRQAVVSVVYEQCSSPSAIVDV